MVGCLTRRVPNLPAAGVKFEPVTGLDLLVRYRLYNRPRLWIEEGASRYLPWTRAFCNLRSSS